MANSAEKMYKCDFCPDRFPTATSAKHHEGLHLTDKPHKCQLCYRSYTDEHQLAKHFKVHTGIKPYKCDYCDRTFSKSNKRTIHMRSHTGEKPYQCVYCKKRFADSDKLNIHIRTHTGEKPYMCEYCQRAFTRSDKRNQHTRNVHKWELAAKFNYRPNTGFQILNTEQSHTNNTELPNNEDNFQLIDSASHSVSQEECSGQSVPQIPQSPSQDSDIFEIFAAELCQTNSKHCNPQQVMSSLQIPKYLHPSVLNSITMDHLNSSLLPDS
ncbi:zinc finger protein 239-like [Argonauta hians]